MDYLPDPAVQYLVKFIEHINDTCPVCQMPALINAADDTGLRQVFCSQCGEFKAYRHRIELREFKNATSRQIANASGYIRHNQGFEIRTPKDFEFLANLPILSPAEKAHSLLKVLAKIYPIAGTEISFPMRSYISYASNEFKTNPQANENIREAGLAIAPLLAFSWAENGDELSFALNRYLIEEVNYIDANSVNITISPRGWKFLESSDKTESNIGFVAMWFDRSMEDVWQNAFHPAIAIAGYTPLRIDKHEHNNKIDDEIMASIRRSKFVVADFTGNRGGVYFEAGFSTGLNIPVIWTVREDCLKELHFDTRQFNHIPWTADDLPKLRKDLTNRIEATLRRGQRPIDSFPS